MSSKAEIIDILSDYVDVPVKEIDTSDAFKAAVGLDSFALLSFIGSVEEHFGIRIPNDYLRTVKTLDDIIAFVDNQ